MHTLDFDPEKMYTWMKGFVAGRQLEDAAAALPFARKCHEGQMRKDGLPYIAHPLTMACHAAALGIWKDTVIAALLLHDVCEDCGVAVEDLPVSQATKDIVRRLTHIKSMSLEDYYKGIEADPDTALCKIFDRCHNVSSMAGAFTPDKTRSYIQESDDHVMPLFRVVKDAAPGYSGALFVLKYHVLSIVNSLAATLPA